MSEYTPKHRSEVETKESRAVIAAETFFQSLTYDHLKITHKELVNQFEQEGHGTGRLAELQMAEIALTYPALYQLIVDMSDTSQEAGRHNAEVQAFADGVEAGAVTLLSIFKYYIDVEKLERSLQD